jgi:hypothetical protein
MNPQHAANNILVDGDAESQRDLLGDAGRTPAGITTFHCNDSVDEGLSWVPSGQAGAPVGAKITCGIFASSERNTDLDGTWSNSAIILWCGLYATTSRLNSIPPLSGLRGRSPGKRYAAWIAGLVCVS